MKGNSMQEMAKYQQLKDAGVSPKHIYLALQEDGIDYITCIKVLRKLLDIPVREAKDLIAEVHHISEGKTPVDELLPVHQTVKSEAQRVNARRILRFLIEVRKRPNMYIGGNVESLPHLLYGITTGAALCGTGEDISEETRRHTLRRIMRERGWDGVSEHVTSTMRRLGYPYQAIINETLTIEMELWQKLFEVQPHESLDIL